MSDPKLYPAKVFWSDEDEGFIAVAPDLPGCSAFGESEAEALKELRFAIEAWLQAAKAAGNPVPAASQHQEFKASGKLLCRLPKSLHSNLIDGARMDGVSVNQMMVSAVARFLGQREGLEVALSALRAEAERCFYDVTWVRPSSGWPCSLVETQTMKITNGSNAPGSLPLLMDVSFAQSKALPALVNYG